MKHAVGVDLGGTKTAVSLVSADGTLGEILTAPTPGSQGPEAVLDTVADLIRRVLPDGEVSGIGVGTAGIVDATVGRIVSATDTFRDWVGTDLPAGLRARLGWGPGRRISVLNDVDAHAVGELRFGAARGLSSLLMVAVGTGVGGSVVLGSQVYNGARHVAGEIGHLPTPGADGLRCACGRMGHLEAIAAGPAMERRYVALGGDTASGREIMERAAHGDDLALTVVRDAAVALGKAVAGVITVLDPEAVVIGGGVAEAGPVWWQPLDRTIRAEVVSLLADIPVHKAHLGPTAALAGAAAQIFVNEEK